MLIDSGGELGTQIARTIKEQFGFSLVAYCDGIDGRIDSYGVEDGFIEEQSLRDIALGEASWFVWRKKSVGIPNETVVAPVSLGGRVFGSLGAVGPPISEPALQAMANLVAITVERARKRLTEGRMEAARQSERLKSVLLDALAHEFVTPLTSIKGAITTIRSEFPHPPDEDDLLAVAEEETDKLNGIISETVDMARIESGRTRIRQRRLPVSDLVQSSLARMASLLDGRSVDVEMPEHILPVSADPELASLALRQLIGNAVKYSPPASRIAISAHESGRMITLAVLDEGPGIPANELEAIFERFYRGSRAHDSIPGTGMGLSIARDIAIAHGGSLKAENRPGGGAQSSLVLPVAHDLDRVLLATDHFARSERAAWYACSLFYSNELTRIHASLELRPNLCKCRHPHRTAQSIPQKISFLDCNVLLEELKAVEVERWLRAADVTDGTKAKLKCVMSALFSHAVRWEFCGHNPISSGVPVGSGGGRGPSTGVRVSAKRQQAPLFLSPEQVKLGLAKLGFRDQLLAFLDGALGTRRGELGALRWSDCNFDSMSFSVQHSYYWRRGGHLKATKTEASAKALPMHPALKDALLEWKSQNEYHGAGDFVFPSRRHRGKKPLDLAAVLRKKIQPAFAKVSIIGVGWHTFRHTVGAMLADMGEHQLTIRDYLRHSNLHVTNKYLQATAESKRLAQGKLVNAILPGGLLSASKSTLIQ